MPKWNAGLGKIIPIRKQVIHADNKKRSFGDGGAYIIIYVHVV